MEKAFDRLMATSEAKDPKAVECLAKDRGPLLRSYDFPAEPRRHIRTTDPIESTFAAARFRPTEVLSSDYCRGLVADDENDQAATADAFDVLNYVAGKRLAAGARPIGCVHGDDLRAGPINAADGSQRGRDVDFGRGIVYLFNAKHRNAHGTAGGADVARTADPDGNRSLFFSHGRNCRNEIGAVKRGADARLAGNNQSVLEPG